MGKDRAVETDGDTWGVLELDGASTESFWPYLLEMEMSEKAFKMHMVLLLLAKAGNFAPSHSLLARRLRWSSTETVRRYKKELASVGLLWVDPRKQFHPVTNAQEPNRVKVWNRPYPPTPGPVPPEMEPEQPVLIQEETPPKFLGGVTDVGGAKNLGGPTNLGPFNKEQVSGIPETGIPPGLRPGGPEEKENKGFTSTRAGPAWMDRSDEDALQEDFERLKAALPASSNEIDVHEVKRLLDSYVRAGIGMNLILAGADRYRLRMAGRAPNYVKSMLNWLRGRCWENEAPSPPGQVVRNPESERDLLERAEVGNR